MLVEKESLDGGEGRLLDRPHVPGGQVLVGGMRVSRRKATLLSPWQVHLSGGSCVVVRLQPCPWELLLSPVPQGQADLLPQGDVGVHVRAVDLAPVDKRCDSVDLLSGNSTFWAENVRPEVSCSPFLAD